MIYGIGLDIVELDRMRVVVARRADRFLQRVFTADELAACERGDKHRLRRLAARFAAKEAVLKSLGTGLREVKWTDAEVVNDESGKPEIVLHGRLRDIAAERGVDQIHISLTHSRDYAAAQAVAVCSVPG